MASTGEIQNSSSEAERKRKRMQSNRESARKSRMRKQKQLNDLMAEVSVLKRTNQQLLNNINITTQHYLKVEAENSVLTAQLSELSSRLQSLNEISNVLNNMSNNNHNHNHNHNHNLGGVYGGCDDELFPIIQEPFASDHHGFFLMNPWSSTTCCLNQPIMASAYMYQC